MITKTYKHKFCKNCSAKFTPKNGKQVYCIQCGKHLNRIWRLNYVRQWRKNHPGYGKTSEEKRQLRLYGNTREYYLFKSNNKCSECGSPEKLELHHIDGNGYGSQFVNNDESNIKVLCRKCHLKTIKWRGNGFK